MDEVFHWDTHVIEGYECTSRCADAGVEHLACGYAGCFERDDEKGDSCCTRTASSYGGSYVVGPYAVGDPFFGAVDKVVGSLPDGGGFDVRYVRASYAWSVLFKNT